MKHQSPPQFFLSMEGECPYISGNRERKLFTTLNKDSPQRVQNELSNMGFRRSQNIVYRPACANCSACLSVRIPSEQFVISKNQKRILSKNKDIAREVRQCLATEEQFEIFQRYVQSRHGGGGMSDMTLEEYAAMVGEPLVSSRIIEYRLLENGRPNQLVACCLSDVLSDGISMVYSFFDPDFNQRSLGTFMILDHIELCKNAHLDYTYLGYWVKNAPNMNYKSKFAPFELFINERWQHFEDPNLAEPKHTEAQNILLRAHRALLRGDQK